jgi:hypothetical protein
MLGIAEEQVDFDAAEGSGDFVHDAGNELFDVEGRGDAVSKFLQANEFGKPERRGLSGRRSGDADIGKGTCGHRETLQSGRGAYVFDSLEEGLDSLKLEVARCHYRS